MSDQTADRQSPRPRLKLSILTIVMLVIATLGVTVAITGCVWQRRLSAPIAWSSDNEAFEHGSIGTEFAPLVVMDVLPDMFPEYFQPMGPNAGDWIEQLGFNRSITTSDVESPALPRGFFVSDLRPVSASASPVPFVGIGCAGCHTNTMIVGDRAVQITGAGGASVNIIAFSEALRAAILDQRLNAAQIEGAYQRKRLRGFGFIERIAVKQWINGFREAALVDAAKYDTPFTEHLLDASPTYPAGPGRTRAFRSLVRVVLDRPGERNWAITKIPAVYSQGLRHVAQFDGSIIDHDSRSALAAMTAGATPQALASRQVEDNIRRTTHFTKNLAAPTWANVVQIPIDAARADRGARLYHQHCFECHGAPNRAGAWQLGRRTGEVIPLAEIGTDPARVNFPHAAELVAQLNKHLPTGHPFHPGDKIRTTNGYVSAPIDGAFSRAPYLHNGSILTLSELIHLEPRRNVFYRGRNEFDVGGVGLLSPGESEWNRDPLLRQQLPFRFDANAFTNGNSNAGHDFPWTRDEVTADPAKQEDLRDLLEYLKGL